MSSGELNIMFPTGNSLSRRLAENLHFAYVGRIATQWSLFELHLDLAAIKISRMDAKIAFCFTSQIIGSARKIDAFISAVKFSGASSFSRELDAFSKETAVLAERRNRAIHDPWSLNDDIVAYRLEVSARKDLKIQAVECSTENLKKLLADIDSHITKLNDLEKRISASLLS